MLEKNFLRPLRLLCSYFNQTQYRTEQRVLAGLVFLNTTHCQFPFFSFVQQLALKKLRELTAKYFGILQVSVTNNS